MADEDMPRRGGGPSCAEILDKGIGYIWQERQGNKPARFGLAKSDGPLTPVEVIQTEPADVGGSYSIACGKQKDGIIPQAKGARAVHAVEYLIEFGLCENIGKPRVAKMLRPSHGEG
jgi:hypothetical protein